MTTQRLEYRTESRMKSIFEEIKEARTTTEKMAISKLHSVHGVKVCQYRSLPFNFIAIHLVPGVGKRENIILLNLCISSENGEMFI